MDTDTKDRIRQARGSVLSAIAAGTVIDIHPFDMAKELANPEVIDAFLINVDFQQYVVVDGRVYNQTTLVPNRTRITQMMSQ